MFFKEKSPFSLSEELPFESKFFQINGLKMHYLDEGAGPVVLLLHGNPTWCFLYRGLIEALKGNFRLIAPDYIGCGLSERSEKSFRAIERVEHLEALIKSLGITKFSLVMHDWGGSIGSMLGVRAPARVDRLVYLNTTLTEVESLPDIIKRAATPPFGKFLTMQSNGFLKLLLEVGVAKKLPSEVKQGFLYPYTTIAERKAIWDFVADIPFSSDHPSYKDLLVLGESLHLLAEKPVQIVWGLKDPCFHKEMLSKVARHFPHAKVLEIPEASHLVLEDAPERAISEIKNFLRAEEVERQAASKPVASKAEEPAVNVLYDSFVKAALKHPEYNALITTQENVSAQSYAYTSFEELRLVVNQYQRALAALGLEPGDKVLMLVEPGLNFLAFTYAVMGQGAAPVFIDPGVGLDKLLKCISDCVPDALIASPKAHFLRAIKRDAFRCLKFSICVHDWMLGLGKNLSYVKHFSNADIEARPSTDVSLIAFTSGATGTPKGVIFSNDVLKAELRIFKDVFGFKSGAKNLSLLPVFSIFNLAMGISSVIPPLNFSHPIDLNPADVVQVIKDLNVEYSFGSPTLWMKIAEHCLCHGDTLPCLESIFMAGAPVSIKTLERVKSLLPNGEVYTPYGATESLPVTLAPATEILSTKLEPAVSGEEGALVGKSIPGLSIKVIQNIEGTIERLSDAKECKALEIGEIIVKGSNISAAYLHRPDANIKSKIKDGQTFWHRMGDMGYLDHAANLYFCGRKAHVVRSAKGVLYSIPCERIYNQHPKVKRSALIALFEGKTPAIVIEPLVDTWPRDSREREVFISELQALGATNRITKDIADFFFHRSFPVDGRHNAKIFRDQLGRWAEEELRKEGRLR